VLFTVVGEAEADVDRGGGRRRSRRGPRLVVLRRPAVRVQGPAPGALHSRGGEGRLQGTGGGDGAVIASGGRLQGADGERGAAGVS
jgi:hypothetical protein